MSHSRQPRNLSPAPQRFETTPVAARPLDPRRAWRALTAIAALDLLLRLLQLVADWHGSPFATQLSEDSLRYWTWAGEISRGKLVGDTPFLSAPLYPYLLGLLRRFGAAIWFVYLLQALCHALTVFVLGWVGARRFGEAAGLLTAGLYALLLDPAYISNRLLPSTLQGLLIGLLLAQFARLAESSSGRGWLLAGGLMGLTVLVFPPALLGVVLVAIWLAALADGTRRFRKVVAWLAGAGLLVLPATLHNWLACGDFIPVSAQGGVTFLQGNAPGAVGVYTIVPGIGQSRETQNQDVLRMYAHDTGGAPDWQQADRYMYRKGFAYWRAEPMRISALLLRKIWWFVSGYNYGDLYYPPIEAALGLAPGTFLAPLPVSWLIPAAGLGLALALRPLRRFGPELILLGIPILVVLLFFYTPRYRFPALPALALLAAAGVCLAPARLRAVGVQRWGIAALLLGSAPLISAINWATGFDGAGPFRANVLANVANGLNHAGDATRAVELYRRAEQMNPQDPAIVAGLAAALIRAGNAAEAWQALEPALRSHPENSTLHEQAGSALSRMGLVEEALVQMQCAVELSPADARLRNNLGSLLINQQRYEEARPHLQEAVRLRPDYVEALLNLALVEGAAGHLQSAIEINRRALQLHPESVNGRRQLAVLEQAVAAPPGGGSVGRR